MANGLNMVMLIGNLGADPELKMTPAGKAVMRLRIATSRSWLDEQRVKQEATEWHTVNVWGKRAEALAKFLSKGTRISIVGELRTRSWDGDDGTKRYSTEVVAREVVLCEKAPGNRPPPPDDTDEPNYGGGGEDDIPF